MLEPTKQFRGEIKPLTGLRGVAALLVVLYHFVNAPSSLGSLKLFDVPHGYLAVDLFFILSGFVLTYNYARVFTSKLSAADYRDFLFKRIARIYPPYLCIMLLYIAKMGINYSGDNPFADFGLLDYVGNLLLISSWGVDIHPLIGPSWSVSAEMFCYFLFPFVVFLVFRRSTLLALLMLCSVAGLILVASVGQGENGPLDVVSSIHFESLLRASCGFFIGLGCYKLHVRLQLLGHEKAAPMALLVYGLCAVIWFLTDSELLRYGSLIAIVMVSSTNDRISQFLFSNRIVYFLGQISYSIYLIHALFLTFAVRLLTALVTHLPFGLAFAFVLTGYVALVLVVSHVSYVVFEMQGRRLMLSLPKLRFRSASA